jgi:hypothetical protein
MTTTALGMAPALHVRTVDRDLAVEAVEAVEAAGAQEGRQAAKGLLPPPSCRPLHADGRDESSCGVGGPG